VAREVDGELGRRGIAAQLRQAPEIAELLRRELGSSDLATIDYVGWIDAGVTGRHGREVVTIVEGWTATTFAGRVVASLNLR